MVGFMDFRYNSALFWSNYSDLTRPHPKWWFSKKNPLISGKPTLVKGGGLMGRELGEIFQFGQIVWFGNIMIPAANV